MAMQNRIAKLCRELRITPYRMSEDIGVSKTTIYALKNKPNQFPGPKVFDGLMRVYGVSADDIVGRVEC
jgi:transcriptional regulator with XRE-family HTH domain